MVADATSRMSKQIDACTDPAKLRQMAVNARRQGEDDLALRATLRLYEILPSEDPGTFEHDVWRSIHALEGTLTEERGKTIRLGRTRQKIAKVGEEATVRDLVLADKASEGFTMLVDRNMLELAFEAVCLRHPDRFDATVIEKARERLRPHER